MGKVFLENLTFTGLTEGKGDRQKQQITYLTRFYIWMREQGLGKVSKKHKI